MKIILYQKIVQLGGTFTFDRNFASAMKDQHEIIYLHEGGEHPLLEEMKKHATIVQNTGQEIEADLCIYSSIFHGAHRIKARSYIQMLHADVSKWAPDYRPGINIIHIAVGEAVASSFMLSHGVESVILANILGEYDGEQSLRLVTASRIAAGKGFERLAAFAHKLVEHGKPFSWEIYGSGSFSYMNKVKDSVFKIPNIAFMGRRTNVQPYMAKADYVVQLSDHEGFCYSMFEALQVGVPVIVTDWQGVRNTVTDGQNGYILDMDLSNLDIETLYTRRPKGDKIAVRNNILSWKKMLESFNY